MNKGIIEKYTVIFDSNNTKENIKKYFVKHDCENTYNHTLDVVNEVQELHEKWDFDLNSCEIGAYIHDLGQVVEQEDIVQLCEENGHDFKTGEKDVPSILHQIASRIIAQKVFNIDNDEILNAIECHTTLKANPSEIEKVVFLSDKLSWKSTEHSDLVKALRNMSEISIEDAITHYLGDLHSKRKELKYYHEWSHEAYCYFNS